MSTIATTKSKNNKAIKLTAERWFHIIESHDYMAGYFHDVLETVSDPDYVVAGRKGELLAAKFYKKTHISLKQRATLIWCAGKFCVDVGYVIKDGTQ